MIERIEELNNKIYKLSSECFDNAHQEMISKEQFEVIKKALYEGYLMEYERLKLDFEKEYQTKKFELEYRNRELIPRYKRKWWKWWKKYPNAAAESIMDEQDVKFEQYYAQRDVIIEKENAKLDEMLDDADDDGSVLKLDDEKPPKRIRKKKVGAIEPTQEVINQVKERIATGDEASSK
jgi:hypothetical protein